MACESHYVAKTWHWAFIWDLWGYFESGYVKEWLKIQGESQGFLGNQLDVTSTEN